MSFSAGQTSAILMVSTFIDDNTTEMSEYFAVMISSVDEVVVIATPNTSVVTIVDNNPGIAYIYNLVRLCEYCIIVLRVFV